MRNGWVRFGKLALLASLFFLSFSDLKAQTGETLDFDGTDDFVTLPNLIPSGSYTKEAWIRTPSFAAGSNLISGTATAFWAPSGQLSAGHNGTFNLVEDPGIMLPNTWYHVAVTYNSATGDLILYRDGVQVDIAVGVANHAETIQYIGAFGSGGGPAFFWAGQIDEVRIWNVARTAVQISNSLSCQLHGDEPGLVGYYNFNQGTAGANNAGVTTLNETGDHCTPLNGTLNNFALNGATSNWVGSGPSFSGTCTNNDANINVSGNSVCITDGDNTPSLTDHTNFGTYSGTGIVRNFTVSNTGGGTLTISNITISGPDAANFSITGSPSSPIASGGSETLQITFSGTGVGARSATVTITNDDGDELSFDFAISGTIAIPSEALQFDGNNDHVTLPNILTPSYTKEAWVYSTNTVGAGNNIVSGAQTALWAPTPTFQLSSGHNGSYTLVQDPDPLLPNTWTHVAVTYDATTQIMSLYKNGALVDQTPGVANHTENALYIGAFTGVFTFNGSIDEVRIWNYARSAAEISNNYNCQLSGDEGGLIAYYNFADGIGLANNAGLTTLVDRSDDCTNNNGTLVNFALNGSTSNWVDGGHAFSGVCTNIPNINLTGGPGSVCITAGQTGVSIADGTDFGTSATPVVHTFTLTNNGTTTLNLTSISFTGSSAANYSASGFTPGALAPGASISFTITMTPTIGGSYSATAVIANDDPDETSFQFAVFGLGSSVLPVTLENFRAVRDRSGVKLLWNTSTEQNNAGFYIQRSANGTNGWTDLGFVAGSGNSNLPKSYSYFDASPMRGFNYYRLRQVDIDGRPTVSDVRLINVNTKEGIFVYPIPAKDMITLDINKSGLLNTEVKMIDMHGKILKRVIVTGPQEQISLAEVTAGVYLLQFADGTTVKVIKQ